MEVDRLDHYLDHQEEDLSKDKKQNIMKIKKNGKVIRLTESDLRRIVKRVISEGKKPSKEEVEKCLSSNDFKPAEKGNKTVWSKDNDNMYGKYVYDGNTWIKVAYLSPKYEKVDQYNTKKDINPCDDF